MLPNTNLRKDFVGPVNIPPICTSRNIVINSNTRNTFNLIMDYLRNGLPSYSDISFLSGSETEWSWARCLPILTDDGRIYVTNGFPKDVKTMIWGNRSMAITDE